MKRRTFIGSLVAAGSLAAISGVPVTGCSTPRSVAYRDVKKRQLLLVAEGIDFNRLSQYLSDGKLPNLSKVINAGSITSIRPDYPLDHYSAAAALVTGLNANKNGIFAEVGRDPKTYLPRFLPYDYFGGKEILGIATSLPKVMSNLSGKPFWEKAIDDGVRTLAIKVPFADPSNTPDGSYILSGLGTPDSQLTPGRYQYFATDLPDKLPDISFSGDLSKIVIEDRKGELKIRGPEVNGEPVYQSIRFEIANSQFVDIIINNSQYSLVIGKYSDYLEFEFPVGDTAKVRAIGRINLISVSPHLRIYISPLGFISGSSTPAATPDSWLSSDETHTIRTTATTDINAYLEGTINRPRLITDSYDFDNEVHHLLQDSAKLEDFGLIAVWFSGIDIAQRTTMHLLDANHPNYDPRGKVQFSDAIDIAYNHFDEILDDITKALPDYEVNIVSTNGATPIHRLFNVNAWLARYGYLSVDKPTSPPIRYADFPIDSEDNPWEGVDWSKSKAYAVGYGQIYLNIEGRERDGIVPTEEAETLIDTIIDKLESVTDNGVSVIAKAHNGRKLFPDLKDAPDIVFELNEGYRVGWHSIFGGVPKDVFEDNISLHSGDFRSVSPAATPGVLISNQANANPIKPEEIATIILDKLEVEG